MNLLLAIVIYTLAMTAANLSVATFGPVSTPFNAFFLIGLDLALRDWLHVRLKPVHMGGLILATGVITYILNPEAGRIAVASAIAFTTAALADWAVFSRLKGSWMKRANGSNIAGAAVDSVIFPTIAFGGLLPQIVVMQFVAKVAGGALWAWLLAKFAKVADEGDSAGRVAGA